MANKTKNKIWLPAKTAEQNSRLVLPGLAAEFFQEGRKIVGDKHRPEDLHSFRLATKRFRYTLELFRPCYGDGLKQRLAQLRQIQQYLGEISDCLTAKALLEQASPRNSKQRAALEKFLTARAGERAGEFRRYWQETFDRPGQETRWVNYLKR